MKKVFVFLFIGVMLFAMDGAAIAASLLFSGTAQGYIYRSNPDGSNRVTIVNAGGGFSVGAMDIYEPTQTIYVTNRSAGTIVTMNFDGTDQTIIHSGLNNPFSLAVDVSGGKVYWSEIGGTTGIKRSNLDGSNVETIITGLPLGHASGFALDTVGEKIYYSGSQGFGVRRANLDGTYQEILFNADLWDLTLDPQDGDIYGSNGNYIYTGKMDGTGSLSLSLNTGDTIFKIIADTDNRLLYYTQPNSNPAGSVRRVNFDGTGDTLLYTGNLQSTGVALTSSVPEPPIQWSGNGHFYEVSNVSLHWSDAKVFAENQTFNGMKGHLVTITSAGEDAFIMQLDLPDTYYHTGALQQQGTQDPLANWTWITGEPWVYENWVGLEPNDAFGEEDNMVVMKAAGGWGDMDGDDHSYSWTENRFIIEYEPSCRGDFDHDGDVDGSDLAVFAADYGRTDCPCTKETSVTNEIHLKIEIERLKAELATKDEEIAILKSQME